MSILIDLLYKTVISFYNNNPAKFINFDKSNKIKFNKTEYKYAKSIVILF